jgi:cell division protein FtsL
MAPFTARVAAPARRPQLSKQQARPAAQPGFPARTPVRRPRPVGVPNARTAPVPRGAALLDAILHGRIWIGIVFALLAGIVFFNVDLLQMNREIAATAGKVSEVKRENSRLRGELARLGSSERIQQVAAERGLVLPAPAEVRYLKSNPTADAKQAAKRLASRQAAALPPATSTTPTTP